MSEMPMHPFGDVLAGVDLQRDDDPESFIDDAEIVGGFIAETVELLDRAEQLALHIEAGAADADDIDSLFRCLHTIKGTSGFFAFTDIAAEAHDAESLLTSLRDGGAEWSLDVHAQLIPRIDRLRQLVHARAPGAAHTRAEDVAATTRVQTRRLDRMMDAIGELVVLHSMLAQEADQLGNRAGRLADLIRNAGKMARELQDLSIDVRMVPLRPSIGKLARVVRDVAQESGKLVELVTEGEETELDRNIVDLLIDPLTHMVRNAVDHGIEAADERARTGKPVTARLRLSAQQMGDRVVIELEDDGRGLDAARIHRRAVQLGWLQPDATPTDADLFQFIFKPGFSTAETVTSLSGRGVGMDVVRRNVENLRGRIDVSARSGQGTLFRLTLPLTLAITDAMLVRIGTERYLIPTLNIQQSFRADSTSLETIAGRGEVALLDELLRVVRLHDVLGVARPVAPGRPVLITVGAAERRCALVVDELVAQQQVIAKPLDDSLRAMPGISAAAILGDGGVALILDIAEIVAMARHETPALAA